MVFGGGRMETIKSMLQLPEEIINEENYQEYKDFLNQAEVILCTWDMVPFSKEQIKDFFSNLKVIFYAAGSVQYFAKPFLESGVRIVTAREIMAVAVAEYTVALIVLANKGALLTLEKYKKEGHRAARSFTDYGYPGTYGSKVGVLGAGAIGGQVIRLLKIYGAEIYVYDPFLPEERADDMGVKLASLEEIFSECLCITNHIANNEKTTGMLDYRLFSMMKDTACFINTGRGAQVVEAGLVQALTEKPGRSAILDVTHPEPSPADHQFFTMPNVFMFPHLGGKSSTDSFLNADGMIAQLKKYQAGEPLDCEVTLEMLQTMA
jgi:phosphoglycerate dehydrogenase-like enzyme